jgi:hypothetical protein
MSRDNEMKAKGKRQKAGIKGVRRAVITPCLLIPAFCFPVFMCVGCSQPRDTEAEARAAIAALQSKLRSCLPESEAEGKVRLAVVSISREQEEARVRLVAYNPADKTAENKSADSEGAVDFDVPNYLLSRGRWLINESGRAYLIDERCREYKLKDRQLTMRQGEAKNGRVRLNPGEACEVTLSFARLPEDVQEVALVYGTRVLSIPLPLNPR